MKFIQAAAASSGTQFRLLNDTRMTERKQATLRSDRPARSWQSMSSNFNSRGCSDQNDYKVCFQSLWAYNGSSSWFVGNGAAYIQENIAKNFGLGNDDHNAVCIMNRKQKEGRWLGNVEEIRTWLLLDYGISAKVFFLSTAQTLQQQAALLRPCRVLINPHGAGNVNWVFLQQNTTVFEAMPVKAYLGLRKYFKNFAATLPGVRYLQYAPDFGHSDMKDLECYKTWKMHKDPKLRRDFEVFTPDQCEAFMDCHWCAKSAMIALPIEVLKSKLGPELAWIGNARLQTKDTAAS